MRKLLSILSVATLLSSTVSSVVACRDKGGGSNQTTNLQAEMLNGAEFISRLIIASRHENLNFNVNELLASLLTPESNTMRLPQSYVYNGQTININEDLTNYRRFLAPSIDSFEQDNQSTTMASYLMGMYDDSFYNSIINGENTFNDTMNRTGFTKINQPGEINAMGYLAGLHKDLKLSSDEDRRALAWGIQDTGALTNYLLYHGFDGGNPGDARGLASSALFATAPKTSNEASGGTNRNGYAFYNSLLQAGIPAGKDITAEPSWFGYSVNKKLDFAGTGLTLKEARIDQGTGDSSNERNISQIVDSNTGETHRFNQVGGTIAANAQENNLAGAISMFSSMFENVSTTLTGSLILAELANYLVPIRVSDIPAETFLQAIGFSLTTNLWEGVVELGRSSNTAVLNRLYANNTDILNSINSISTGGSLRPLKLDDSVLNLSNNSANIDQIGLRALYEFAGRDNNDEPIFSEDAKGIYAERMVKMIDLLIEDYENSNSTRQKQIAEDLFQENGVIGRAYIVPLTLINLNNPKAWDNMIGEDGRGAINLMKLARGVFQMVANPDIYATVRNTIDNLGEVGSFRNLTPGERQQFTRFLGYTGSSYNDGSYLGKIYSAVTDENVDGNKEFIKLFRSLNGIVNEGMAYGHEKVYQYLFDDKYWNRTNFKINTTSNTDLTGELELTLNYTGVGDSSSNASKQHTKVEVPDDFNPYQIIYKNQSEEFLGENAPLDEARALIDLDRAKKSGRVLGVEQGIIDAKDLVAYDGTGLFENLEPVNFEYRVRWNNISSDPNNPYWVITAIDCFDENGNQFFNIY